ncbi:DUF2946 family protein [Janthinobacterium psychrotolerans]|uniref:DUF2946 domain-containing protein n=1 Tax=Janthinobacterium psychrotolerans TaxID=1747903 RepID=A0A1A7C4H5_9BURK|nr:DUF2946 family protein [Janthinobacterium psychrotolerans]OBV39645.1 Protein of unknown function (DUF2946) [Janthinobacterium psychrotolerans]
MGHFLQRKQWSLWFACLALLLNALSPSLSHAFAGGQGNAVVDICSASGAVYTQADLAALSGSRPDTQPDLRQIEHCLYCMHHAASLALPPAPPLLAVIKGHDAYPPLLRQAPQPQFAWQGARPRGPPSIA